MTSSPLLLLLAYTVAILATACLGMWIQSAIQLTHTRMQVAMSFVAGLILGVALYHLIPHSVAQISTPRALETAVWWIVVGMLVIVLLLRVFRFHQHNLVERADRSQAEQHRHSVRHQSLSWLGVSVGLGMHALTEGAALGASVRSSLHGSDEAVLVSFGVFLAIVFHKPLDAYSILGLMRLAGVTQRWAVAVNCAIAMICPVGAFLTYWGIGFFGPSEADVAGRALAFGAGALLCVALSDLLPDLQFHGHDRFLLTGSLVAGVSLAYALHYLERLSLFGRAI